MTEPSPISRLELALSDETNQLTFKWLSRILIAVIGFAGVWWINDVRSDVAQESEDVREEIKELTDVATKLKEQLSKFSEQFAVNATERKFAEKEFDELAAEVEELKLIQQSRTASIDVVASLAERVASAEALLAERGPVLKELRKDTEDRFKKHQFLQYVLRLKQLNPDLVLPEWE